MVKEFFGNLKNFGSAEEMLEDVRRKTPEQSYTFDICQDSQYNFYILYINESEYCIKIILILMELV